MKIIRTNLFGLDGNTNGLSPYRHGFLVGECHSIELNPHEQGSFNYDCWNKGESDGIDALEQKEAEKYSDMYDDIYRRYNLFKKIIYGLIYFMCFYVIIALGYNYDNPELMSECSTSFFHIEDSWHCFFFNFNIF